MLKKIRVGVHFALAVLLVGGMGIGFVSHLAAQGATATILGTVTDMSGAAIPDAAVTVKNLGTGTTGATTSDAQGRFRVSELGVGEYQVEASKMGFSNIVHTGITLTVGAQTVVDLALPVGQQTQTVTVESQVSQVETTNGAVGSLTDSTQMHELPLNGRNFEQLIQLAPGVQTYNAFNASALQGRGTLYSVAGARPAGQAILLDDENMQGFSNRGIGSISGSSLGVESIGEFQTLTNSYGAQFAGNGAVINSVSKSGTNAFHGSAYDFFRNDKLDADSFFHASTGVKQLLRKNQYGGSLGGPVKKDKLFFFVNYEGIQQSLGETRIALVPNCPSACVPNATLPAATRQAISNTLAIFPMPDPGTVGANNIGTSVQTGVQPSNENYVLGRMDYNLSSKDSIFGRYLSDKANLTEPFGGGGPAGGPLNFWTEFGHSHNQFLTVEERHLISPTIVNLFRASFARQVSSARQPGVVTVNGTQPLQFFPGMGFGDGGVQISGLSNLGEDLVIPFNQNQNRFTEADDILWTKGAHSIRVGFMGDRLLNNSWNPISENVVWTFTSFPNFLAGNASVESGVIPAPGNTAHRDYFQYHFAPYAQDDWKVSQKLTVNMGIRYEAASNVTERHDLLYTLLDYYHDTDFTRVPHVFQNNPSLKNFDPRIGIAYDPFANHKTAIRAGFGLFHDPISVQAYQTGFGGAYPWRQAALTAPNAIYPNSPTGTPPLSQTLPWYYPISSTPYMIQYNLNIQHEVLPNTVLSVGYVGSKGTHLLTGIEANPPTPTIDANGVYHFGTPTGPIGPNGLQTAVTPFPRLNPGIQYMTTNRPISDSRYNSLQVSVNRRLSRSVQAQLSYTYSKCMDDGAFGVGSFNGLNTTPSAIENPFNQKIDKA